MISTVHTPGCSAQESPFLAAPDRNRRLSGDVFPYVKCARCGLIRLAEAPADLSRYYPDEYYELPSLPRLNRLAGADPFKIALVRRFAQSGRLLEIGPAHGVFAYQAKQAGFEVDTIEMDARCCDHLRNTVGVNAWCSASPHEVLQTVAPYDVIALWHVIEHVPDPWTLLRHIAAALTPGGIVVIAAPNPQAWQFAIMQSQWPHLDAPRHLYLLPAAAISSFLSDLGLESVHVTTTDSDARRWNRFGWQRLLMNQVPGKWAGRAAYLAGTVVSAVAAPFESRDPRGSAYTLVFRSRAA